MVFQLTCLREKGRDCAKEHQRPRRQKPEQRSSQAQTGSLPHSDILYDQLHMRIPTATKKLPKHSLNPIFSSWEKPLKMPCRALTERSLPGSWGPTTKVFVHLYLCKCICVFAFVILPGEVCQNGISQQQRFCAERHFFFKNTEIQLITKNTKIH